MAELILDVKTVPSKYEYGDIIHALNDRSILQSWTEQFCHVKKVGFNSDGLRLHGSLADYFQNTCYNFKFERINRTEIKKTNLKTHAVEIIENIYLDLYLQRRKQHSSHNIFGQNGLEYWYGGHVDYSQKNLDIVWEKIESDLQLAKSDYMMTQPNPRQLQKYLFLSVNDFSDVRGFDLVSHYSNIKYRKWYVVGIEDIVDNMDKVQNIHEIVDIRKIKTFNQAKITKRKFL